MKFIGTSTKTETTCDGVHDPKILSHQLLNTKKSPRFKKYNQVRISEIGTFCSREYALGFLTDAQQKSFVDFGLQTQFDIGSALHWYYQNRSKVFKIYGNWFCMSCEKTRMTKYGTKYFGQKPMTKCLNCGASPKATEYEELYFRLEKPYRIVGKIDGVIEKDGVYRLIDFKSYFEKPQGGFPAAKDVAQLSAYAFFYNYIPEEQKFPVPIDTSTSYLHYISKKFSFSESILTYKVQPSEKLIEIMKERVRSFTVAAEGGPLPSPFDICIRNDFESGRAKDCFMREQCKQKYQENH
jgi:hypothetical protein